MEKTRDVAAPVITYLLICLVLLSVNIKKNRNFIIVWSGVSRSIHWCFTVYVDSSIYVHHWAPVKLWINACLIQAAQKIWIYIRAETWERKLSREELWRKSSKSYMDVGMMSRDVMKSHNVMTSRDVMWWRHVMWWRQLIDDVAWCDHVTWCDDGTWCDDVEYTDIA